MGDEKTVHAILHEGKTNNQVMEHLTHLTQNIGPRLTGSSRALKANEWCRDQYIGWGLANPHLEQWGEIATGFDRGPSTAKLVLRREVRPETERGGRRGRGGAGGGGAGGSEPALPGTTTASPQPPTPPTAPPTPTDAKPEGDGTEVKVEPAPVKIEYQDLRDLTLSTQSWTSGTTGAVRAPIVKEPKTEDEFAAVKDKLAGAYVLIAAPAPVGQRGIRSVLSARFSLRLDARKKVAEGTAEADLSIPERIALIDTAGYISTSRDERVWTGAAPGWRERVAGDIPKDVHIVVRGSDYDAINSRVADGEPVELDLNLEHTFNVGPVPVYNTVAEIRGTTWPDEVVIVSAHLDSWDGPGSQGTTDNGTGTVVTLEAARILMAVNAKPKRTIRFIHWTGEEQGLLGSKGYIESHKDELGKISAVFVDDGGTNSEGGLNCADAMVPMLAAATAPINNQFYSEVDGKFLNVNVKGVGKRNPRGGGSDHATFNKELIPGFFWDEVGRADYGYGWHTQHDRLDLAVPEYLKQSSTNAAITAYRLACADTMLPREEPEPEAPKEEPAPSESVTPPVKPEGDATK